MVTRIAVLGAECTGKTQLAQELLQTALQHGDAALVVPEVLRDWCDKAGRTPQAHEQAPIAQAQAAALNQAVATLAANTPPATGQTAMVISDTSALMTAVYSDVVFGDTTLYPWALAQQRAFEITLVTGLDLPWVPDGIQRDGPTMRAQIDARLRAVLDAQGLAYTLVYGTGPSRLQCALKAIGHQRDAARATGPHTASGWQWTCEKCSDASCEHQLFSALLRNSTH